MGRTVLTMVPIATFETNSETAHPRHVARVSVCSRHRTSLQHQTTGIHCYPSFVAPKPVLQLSGVFRQGFFVKSGQLIALQAFVPTIIREKLSAVQDDMPPMSPSQAAKAISNELQKLGYRMEVFDSIDLENVLGSASIAQVHRATLRDGKTTVAVKVQFPDIERRMMADLANFRLLGVILQKTELKFDLVRPIQELQAQVLREFDFEGEAKAMTELERILKGVKGVSVPRVVPGLVSRRILVMTFLDGMPLARLGRKRQLRKQEVRYLGRRLMHRLSEAYAKMILSEGYFQADCHPGNILIRNARVDIGLLDFGQTKRFTELQRCGFVRLVDAMARKDSAEVRRGMAGLGIQIQHLENKRPKKTSLSPEEQLAYTMFDTAAVPGVSDNPFAEDSVLRSVSVEYLPKDLMFLLRTMQIMKGIAKMTFNTDFSMVSSWRKTAQAELRKSRKSHERTLQP